MAGRNTTLQLPYVSPDRDQKEIFTLKLNYFGILTFKFILNVSSFRVCTKMKVYNVFDILRSDISSDQSFFRVRTGAHHLLVYEATVTQLIMIALGLRAVRVISNSILKY